MNKRVLMLSAATAALFLGPAFADDLDVTTGLTTPVTTANANNGPGDITIESSGSITITQAGPAVTINSSNSVTNSGLISNMNTDDAIGIEIDTGTAAGYTGTLVNNGKIDLSGKGTDKIGIAVIGTGTFSSPDPGTTDVIQLGSASTINIVGDGSIGVDLQTGSTLNGNVNLGGIVSVGATTATATSGGVATAIEIADIVNGNVTLATGSAISATGQGAQGLIMSGTISGSLQNFGSLEAIGTINPSTSATNPEAGNAMSISGSILGGFINAGPVSTSDDTAVATIVAGGIGDAVLINPTFLGVTPTAPLDIGIYTTDINDPGYSFYNRGTISAAPIDPNSNVTAISLGGTSAFHTTLHGLGMFNAGTITANAISSSASPGAIAATAISVGDYAFLSDGGTGGGLFNSNERGIGVISASISGTNGGAATAIVVSPHGSLPEITNQGTISATATTTETSNAVLSAVAIDDLSGTLSKITNSGTIIASATTLDSGAQIAEAAYLGANSTGVDFENTGTVIGDIVFGTGGDTLNVSGVSASAGGTVTGAISFGDTLVAGTVDRLTVGNFGTVTGNVTEAAAGTLDVSVDTRGALNLTNTADTLFVRNFDIGNPIPSAANGALSITVASTLANNLAIHASNEATIEDGANVQIKFGSFLPEAGDFVLIQTPNGALHIDQAEFNSIKNNFDLPFLFNGGLCTFNVATILASDQCNGTLPGTSELVLSVVPKTADELGLTGNAATIFPFASAALVTDPLLGAAVVNGVTDTTSAQAAFQAFVPDASGGTRAVAISLTDSATGPVAARQRELRLYANQPGDTTLWGNEFAQFINDKGNNGLPGFQDRGFGLIMGIDTGDSIDGWYGGAFTFFSGDVDQQAPANTRSNDQWYMLSGYTDWRGKGLFIDSQLTVGYGDLSGHRFVDIGGVSREADSKHSSLLGALGATAGTVFVYGATTLTPQVSLDALTMRQDGYSEANGGTGFDLSISPFYASSFRGFVGGSARQDFNFGDFYLQPEVRLGYRYDVLADAVKLRAAFTSIPDSEFSVIGPDPERGNLVAGASIAGTTGAWSLGLHYDFVRGNNGSTTQVGTVSLLGRI